MDATTHFPIYVDGIRNVQVRGNGESGTIMVYAADELEWAASFHVVDDCGLPAPLAVRWGLPEPPVAVATAVSGPLRAWVRERWADRLRLAHPSFIAIKVFGGASCAFSLGNLAFEIGNWAGWIAPRVTPQDPITTGVWLLLAVGGWSLHRRASEWLRGYERTRTAFTEAAA